MSAKYLVEGAGPALNEFKAQYLKKEKGKQLSVDNMIELVKLCNQCEKDVKISVREMWTRVQKDSSMDEN